MFGKDQKHRDRFYGISENVHFLLQYIIKLGTLKIFLLSVWKMSRTR